MLDVTGRVPPHDLDAEAAILSAVMLDPEAIAKIPDLRPMHYYSEAHNRIFEACIELRSSGSPVDVVTVASWLKDRQRLAQVGGMPYLGQILDSVPVIGNVASYARIVIEKYRVRQLILACQYVVANGYHDYGDADAFIGSARAGVDRVAALAAPRTVWDERTCEVTPEWFASKPPPRRWLLVDPRRQGSPGMLPLGRVGMLVGAGGAGKTLALLDLAMSIATGSAWLGTFSVASPGRVFVLLPEEDRDEVHRRVYAVRSSRGMVPPQPGTIIVAPLTGETCEMLRRDPHGNLAESAFLIWLRERVRAISDLRAIVLDPFARFAGPDAEKDNACATRSVAALESLAVASGATVIAGHHSGQNARGEGPRSPDAMATAARGVTALTDGVRWVATLKGRRVEGLDSDVAKRLADLVTFDWAKSNYSLRWGPVECRRDTEHGGALVPLDDHDRKMLDAVRYESPPTSSRHGANGSNRPRASKYEEDL